MKSCEITGAPITGSAFHFEDGFLVRHRENADLRAWEEYGFKTFRELSESQPDKFYEVSFPNPEEWYSMDDELHFVLVFHDRLTIFEDIIKISPWCSFRLVPECIAEEFAEAMLQTGKWSNYVIPQLAFSKPIQFILNYNK
jgi:hypothetical protein